MWRLFALFLTVLISQTSCEDCSGVLFAYFLGDDEKIRYASSRDGFHFEVLNHGNPIPALLPTNGTSTRDPFVAKGPDGKYHLVATDGAGFGNTQHILHWESTDLIHWSAERVISVMEAYGEAVATTWAPEWVWDANKQDYLVFWASRWKKGREREHFEAACDNPNLQRNAFWSARTKDWMTFSQPELMFDPGCMNASFAPMHFSSGGIDGDIVAWNGTFLLYYKDLHAPVPVTTPGLPLQKTSGVRVSESADLKSWSAPKPNPGFIGPYGTSGPEVVVVNNSQARLYFDCDFQPTPQGYPKAPYGVATAHYPSGLLDTDAWSVVPGSCTGKGSQVKFPKGACHGSFICVGETEYQALHAAFGNEQSVIFE